MLAGLGAPAPDQELAFHLLSLLLHRGRWEGNHLLIKFPLPIYIKKGKLFQEARKTFITLNL